MDQKLQLMLVVFLVIGLIFVISKIISEDYQKNSTGVLDPKLINYVSLRQLQVNQEKELSWDDVAKRQNKHDPKDPDQFVGPLTPPDHGIFTFSSVETLPKTNKYYGSYCFIKGDSMPYMWWKEEQRYVPYDSYVYMKETAVMLDKLRREHMLHHLSLTKELVKRRTNFRKPRVGISGHHHYSQ